jgi:ABC-type uncharacterized transport system substrate-binding protein
VSRRTHNLALLPRLAAELVDLKVDVIVTSGSPYAAVAAKEASSTIPIVSAFEYDPIKYGLVTSLSRPGGNVTGMTFLTTELARKRLSILRDMIPQATTIAYLSVSGAPISEQLKSDMIAAGRALERESRHRWDGSCAPRVVERRAGRAIPERFSRLLAQLEQRQGNASSASASKGT